MKKLATLLLLLMCVQLQCVAASGYQSKTWAALCKGEMGADWYGSDEAKSVADTLIATQKTNGGWMKNYQYHILTATELKTYKSTSSRVEHSCFDNGSTTQEMRFLAKVYNKTGEERYLTSLKKALNLIFTAGKNLKGGWAQYWPLSSDTYSYQNYITFNDDLMTNIMKLLMEIYQDKGDFAGLFDEETRTKCKTQFDSAIECVINCQVDDNGTKSAWCAQHDPADFLPVEGRPHELPSISGCESASLLSFLMTVPNPSKELQECITAGVTWLQNHKYMENAAIEDYTNSDGVADRRIVTKQGSNLWGRFIQIGGESGQKIYEKFYNKLKARGKKREHSTTGYTYYEYQIAEASYDSTKAYQPIYAIYSNDYPELFYRYLYNYEDTPDAADKYGQTVKTSLLPGNRRSYQYLGGWADGTIQAYTAWKAQRDIEEIAGDNQVLTLSQATYSSSTAAGCWVFDNGFTITNAKSKGYASGVQQTVKYSAGVDFTITIPDTLVVNKVTFYGYDNYNGGNAYISKCNGKTFAATDYVFPEKSTQGVAVYVTHTLDLTDSPAAGTLPFTVAGKQTCLIITLYCGPKPTSGIRTIAGADVKAQPVKCMQNNRIVVVRDGKRYNTAGQLLAD